MSGVHLGQRTQRKKCDLQGRGAQLSGSVINSGHAYIFFFFTKEKERTNKATAKLFPQPPTTTSIASQQVVNTYLPAKTTHSNKQWLCLGLHFTHTHTLLRPSYS